MMDIKSLLSVLSSKKGINPDVKNKGIGALTAEDEPAKGKNFFAKVLAAEDSKTSTLLADATPLPLSAGEWPLLPTLPPPQNFLPPPPGAMLYTATAPLLYAESKNFEYNDTSGGVTPLTSPLELKSTPSPSPSTMRPVAHVVSPESIVSASAVPLAKPETLPFSLPIGEIAPVLVEGRPTVALAGFIVPAPLASGQRQVSADVATDLDKRRVPALPRAAAAISLVSFESQQGLVLPTAKISKPTIKNENRDNETLNLSSTAHPWSLDEAGKKNEALLDVLALGGRPKAAEGLAQAVKPEVYAFQREAVTETAVPNHQSLVPSQSLATDASPVSDKNGYWLASGTQNVSLTLGGLGEEAVAVKISVSGHETQVNIRTDQLALRQLIEGTVQEMKAQLSTEGLTLSGLSVGGTSQEQAMSQGTGSNTGMSSAMSTGAETGQGAGGNSHRQTLPEDSASKNSNQLSSTQNRTVAPLSRMLPSEGRKLSVFV